MNRALRWEDLQSYKPIGSVKIRRQGSDEAMIATSDFDARSNLRSILYNPSEPTADDISLAEQALERLKQRSGLSDEQWATELAMDFKLIID